MMPSGYVFQVDESSPVESAVGTVVATDDDGGSAGTVSEWTHEGVHPSIPHSQLALETYKIEIQRVKLGCEH